MLHSVAPLKARPLETRPAGGPAGDAFDWRVEAGPRRARRRLSGGSGFGRLAAASPSGWWSCWSAACWQLGERRQELMSFNWSVSCQPPLVPHLTRSDGVRHECVCEWVCVSGCVWVWLCVTVCVNVCDCVCEWKRELDWIFIYIYISLYIYIYISIYINLNIYICKK